LAPRHKLTAFGIRALPPGKHSDGGGLLLFKREDGGGQWIFRFTYRSCRRDMGLGGLRSVSLKLARELADAARVAVARGVDPIAERDRLDREARRLDTTLSVITASAFEARKAELKDDGVAGDWWGPLKLYVLPTLGDTPVSDITQHDLVGVLSPIWHTRADTAKKALTRVGLVLKHAAALGIDVDMQAVEKARALLGKTRHVVTNLASVPWRDMPQLYRALCAPDAGIVELALRLLILTGSRSGPIRRIHVDQIADGVWTIPGEGMKGKLGKTDDFRIPLSDEAQRVIELARPFVRGGNLFPGGRGVDGVIGETTMLRWLERRGVAATPHGFRSSLRTWLAEATDASHEVSETVLAHTTGTSVSRVYIHTDMLEQRAILMQRWADLVTGASGKVLQLAEAC
jgi:integrase